jgi:three-Cys-motif partner protein
MPEDNVSSIPLLEPIEDGLTMRNSQEYAKDKLRALSVYISIVNMAMKSKWSHRYFIDLQAGPGKNQIGKEVVLGSPLIALTNPIPFTRYIFNELDPTNADALEKRVATSPIKSLVSIYQLDANEVVHQICQDIEAKSKAIGQSLNMAFLDPEGLELHWSTVERLAKVPRMDLIINFSTSGLLRSHGKNTRFYGNENWQDDFNLSDTVSRRRKLIGRYLDQLKSFGYYIEENPDVEHSDISFKNSKNAEVYSLIFASKNELGEKFWRQSKKTIKPPRLPGL